MDTGRLPLLAALLAFLLTFLVTRGITRLIRAGRGPFRDNVTPGGVHIHHAVPGVLLMVAGGFALAAIPGTGAAKIAACMVFGVGTGLVLDEFALIIHLADVYWTDEGRASVEAITLTTAALLMVLLGSVPFGIGDAGQRATVGWTVWILAIVADLLYTVVAFAKGKIRMGVLGLFVPVIGLVAAVRLARPASPWAKRFYADKPAKLDRATRQTARHDGHWQRLLTRVQDWIAGAPDRGGPGRGGG
ncbi:hypothetical protein GCM10009738_16430 [Kitasatospora viridis]|uniref:Integral membrane protein n=1 Tax=Kitasatospora viridis TaxID=281105 RepID=A0A561T633_9ACTN|nr:hypothetical protein FHX73_1457 [Kitasatospora viridis]